MNNQCIMTQHDESVTNANQDSSLPSVKLSFAHDRNDSNAFESCSQVKNQGADATYMSA